MRPPTHRKHANTQPSMPRAHVVWPPLSPFLQRGWAGGGGGWWSIMVSYHPIRHFHCRQSEGGRSARHLTKRARAAVKCKPHLPRSCQDDAPVPPHAHEEHNNKEAEHPLDGKIFIRLQSSVGNGPLLPHCLTCVCVACLLPFFRHFRAGRKEGEGTQWATNREGGGGGGVSVVQFE